VMSGDGPVLAAARYSEQDSRRSHFAASLAVTGVNLMNIPG
jgi:hypothetical protein